MDPRTAFDRLVKRVEGVRVRQTAISWLAFLLEVAAIALAAIVLLVLLEIVLGPGRAIRTALTLTLCAAATALILTRIVRLVRALPSRSRAARRIEIARPEVGDGAVMSALSLWPKRDDQRHGYSQALIDAHLAETAARSEGPAPGALEARSLRTAAVALAAVLAIALGGRLLAPVATDRALARLAEASTRRAPDVRVTPGDVRVVAGSDVVVHAEVTPPAGRSIVLATRETKGSGGMEAGFSQEDDFPEISAGTHERRFTGVERSFDYQVRIQDWRSPVSRGTVPRPP